MLQLPRGDIFGVETSWQQGTALAGDQRPDLQRTMRASLDVWVAAPAGAVRLEPGRGDRGGSCDPLAASIGGGPMAGPGPGEALDHVVVLMFENRSFDNRVRGGEGYW